MTWNRHTVRKLYRVTNFISNNSNGNSKGITIIDVAKLHSVFINETKEAKRLGDPI